MLKRDLEIARAESEAASKLPEAESKFSVINKLNDEKCLLLLTLHTNSTPAEDKPRYFRHVLHIVIRKVMLVWSLPLCLIFVSGLSERLCSFQLMISLIFSTQFFLRKCKGQSRKISENEGYLWQTTWRTCTATSKCK